MGHIWTVYMATDHNILSPASVRVFTVLLCVCLCTANCIPCFFHSTSNTSANHDRQTRRHCRHRSRRFLGRIRSLKAPDKFPVTVFDKELDAGSMTNSIDIDSTRYVASHINDGVQGCSPANTLHIFRELGYPPEKVVTQ